MQIEEFAVIVIAIVSAFVMGVVLQNHIHSFEDKPYITNSTLTQCNTWNNGTTICMEIKR